MGVYEDAPEAVFRFRFSEMVSDMKTLLSWKSGIDIAQERQDARITNLADAQTRMAEAQEAHGKKLDSVNATLNKLLVGITGSALVLSFSVLVATGKVL